MFAGEDISTAFFFFLGLISIYCIRRVLGEGGLVYCLISSDSVFWKKCLN